MLKTNVYNLLVKSLLSGYGKVAFSVDVVDLCKKLLLSFLVKVTGSKKVAI